ncbi:MAG: IS3 family transposase [Actinobacteria bacterium]|nr:IS3 family transposase [Actinomycetota bacterium]
MRFEWIHRQRESFEVSVMCEVLQVSRGGYYAWVDRPPGARQRRRKELIEQIRQVHEESHGTYGSPRTHAELVERDIDVCVNTVAKLMKQAQIRSVMHRCRKFVPATTDSDHDLPVAPNRLDRQFAADLPDQKWACDITYVPTREGFLYLAAVIDLCSRKIVGWSMADHLRTELCTDALEMALRSRRPGSDLLHHSDRGVQYASVDYQRLLRAHGIAVSMSRLGDCYDNAMMESFWGTLKTELVHHVDYATREEARSSIFRYIECWYNRRRRHSAIGYKSPEQFEASLN